MLKRRLTLLMFAYLAGSAILDGIAAGWTPPHFNAAAGWVCAVIYRWTTPE